MKALVLRTTAYGYPFPLLFRCNPPLIVLGGHPLCYAPTSCQYFYGHTKASEPVSHHFEPSCPRYVPFVKLEEFHGEDSPVLRMRDCVALNLRAWPYEGEAKLYLPDESPSASRAFVSSNVLARSISLPCRYIVPTSLTDASSRPHRLSRHSQEPDVLSCYLHVPHRDSWHSHQPHVLLPCSDVLHCPSHIEVRRFN